MATPVARARELRTWGVVALLIALAAARPAAFIPSLHGEITADGLSGGFVPGFSRRAIEEISAANRIMDTGDCAVDTRNDPALPCRFPVAHGEELEAKMRAAAGHAVEHFDDEEIQAGHLRLVDLRRQIVDAILRDDFVGARRLLGSALHSLQDFYSHSNWVELGNTRIETRLATTGFLRGYPPISPKTEGTCGNDQRIVLGLRGADTLIPGVTTTGGRPAVEQWARLTTGYFPDNAREIVDNRKCAHGAVTGLNKDTPLAGPKHDTARRLASQHTAEYTASILRDDKIRNLRAKIDGFLGIESDDEVDAIESLDIGVPGAPGGASWDTAIGSALGFFVLGTQGLKNIQPDVLVCLESSRVGNTCDGANVSRITCMDADWSLELNAYVCRPPLPHALLAEPDLRVRVMEVDLGEPRREIARFRVEDPRRCDPFCTLQLDPDRAIWVRFQVGRSPKYLVPTRRPVRLTPATRTPVALPSASGTTTTTAPLPRSSASASPSAAPPLRTPEGIDARLALRDADNCSGADAFYPAIPVGAASPVAAQTYQMAAFSLAITDQQAKQAVLNAVQAKVGTDAFFAAITSVIADPVRSQALVLAYQNTARNVVEQVAANGLTTLLPTPKPPSALLPDVDRWILSRLSSPALVSSALDLMAGLTPLTAECTVNELARQGFTATVLP